MDVHSCDGMKRRSLRKRTNCKESIPQTSSKETVKKKRINETVTTDNGSKIEEKPRNKKQSKRNSKDILVTEGNKDNCKPEKDTISNLNDTTTLNPKAVKRKSPKTDTNSGNSNNDVQEQETLANTYNKESLNFENFKSVDLAAVIHEKKVKLNTPEKNSHDSAGFRSNDADIRKMLLQFENIEEQPTIDKEESFSDDSDWEDVADVLPDSEEISQSQIPSGPVEITLEKTDIMRKKKKKKFDIQDWFRLQMNKFKRQTQSNVHKVHLLCLISHGMWRLRLCQTPVLQAVVLSHIPVQFQKVPAAKWTMSILQSFTGWFEQKFSLESESDSNLKGNLLEELLQGAEVCTVTHYTHMVYLFLSALLVLNLEIRLVKSVYPVSHKASDLKAKKGDGEEKAVKIKNNDTNDKATTSKSTDNSNVVKKSASSKQTTNKCPVKRSGSLKNTSKKNVNKTQTDETVSPYFSEDSSQESKLNKDSASSSVKNVKKQRVRSKSETKESQANKSGIRETQKKMSRRKSASKVSSYCELSDASDNDKNDSNEMKKTTHNITPDTKTKSKHNTKTSDVSFDSSDEDFIEEDKTYRSPIQSQKQKSLSGSKKKKPIKIVSSDSENSVQVLEGCNTWVEVYLETEKKWICVDCVNNIVDKPNQTEVNATQPVQYILSFCANGYIKDLTRKYVPNWMAFTRKLRHDDEWWRETLLYFTCPSDDKSKDEDRHVQAKLMSQPMPTAIGDFKHHPLYALKRHLLKFEAIYPSDAPPLGFIRSEPVYARECVHTLHSRENWIKEGRAVRIGEEAYKWVKSRPKRKRVAENTNEPTLALFGHWQTEEYIPPPAVDGKVPRNEYGNVELFKPSMLPAGTVHLQGFPGLNRVARKLALDAVPAMTGWDQHGGFPHPILDGWVVCVEHKDTLIAAWDEQQEIDRQREIEKREKRVLENWRKLTKGLLIKQKIKKKYNLVDKCEKEANAPSNSTDELTEETSHTTKATDAQMSWPLNRQEEKEKKKSKTGTGKKSKKDETPKFPFEMEVM